MKSNKVTRRIFSGLATAALLTLSCPAWSQQEPLRIGAILALSGPASVYGSPAEKGLKVMLEQLAGKTLAGHPVELTVFDTEGNSTKAVQLFRRLADNNDVHVIVGPSTSGESLAIVPVANELKVPNISNGGAEQITVPVTPYVFGMAPTDRLVVQLTLETLVKRNQKKVALIHSQDGFGQSGGGIVQAQAAGLGIELVTVETFSPQDTNMTPQLLRIREKNPDAIVIWAPNPGPTIILKNMVEMGLKKPTYLSYANSTMSFVAQTGPASEGVYCGALPIIAPESLPQDDPRRAPMLTFDQAYRKQFNQAPDMTAGHGLDDFIILEAALKTIKGPLTRDSLRNALETVKMCGANGCRQLTTSDHRGLTKDAAVLMQVKNGKWEAVQP